MNKKDFVEKWGYRGGRLTFDCREDLEKDLGELLEKPICNICNGYLDADSFPQICSSCGKSKLIENGFCNCCGGRQ